MLRNALITTLLVVLLAHISHAATPPSVAPREVLLRWKSSTEWLEDCRLRGTTDCLVEGPIPPRRGSKTDYTSVVVRNCAQVRLDYVIHSLSSPAMSGNRPESERWQTVPWHAIFDASANAYEWDGPDRDRRRPVLMYAQQATDRRELLLAAPEHFGPLLGYLISAADAACGNVASALLPSADLSIEEATGPGDVPCWAISGPVPGGGTLCAWFDRETNVLRRWRLEKRPTDTVRGKIVSSFGSEYSHTLASFEEQCDIDVEPAVAAPDGKQAIKGGRLVNTLRFTDGERIRITYTMRVTSIEVKPKLPPDTFDVNLPNGTQVAMSLEQGGGISREWRDGAVRPIVNRVALTSLAQQIQEIRKPNPASRTWEPPPAAAERTYDFSLIASLMRTRGAIAGYAGVLVLGTALLAIRVARARKGRA